MNSDQHYSMYPRGFYYDTQISNPLLTATLHPNTYISNVEYNGEDPYSLNKPFEWSLYDPNNSKEPCLEPLTYNFNKNLNGGLNPSECYRRRPLVTAILNEDFQVNIGNAWNDQSGGQELENLFNSLKAYSPFGDHAGIASKQVSEKLDNISKNSKSSIIGKTSGMLSKIAGKAGDLFEKNSTRLNGALIIQGTRFSYYGGSSTTFGNLSIKFTLFADWILDKNGKPQFKTVHDQLLEIYPYAIGKYDPVEIPKDWTDSKSKVWQTTKETGADIISTYFGWQSPPGGFRANTQSLDTCQKGTLRLVLGGYYTAENLVIESMNVNFSKMMTKIPTPAAKEEYTFEVMETTEDGFGYITTETISGPGKHLTPLYADVVLTLKPATNYTDDTIIKFSSNHGKGYIDKEIAKLRNDALKREEIKRSTPNIKIPKQKIADIKAGINSNISEKDLLEKLPERMVKVQQPNVENPRISIDHWMNI